MTFQLDFAPHLGFPSPDAPLFAVAAGDASPAAQIEFAASNGFRRVQDPFAASRSVADQKRIGDAASANGLTLGCFVYAPLTAAFRPGWAADNDTDRRTLDDDLTEAIAIGHRLGSGHIAVLTGHDPSRTREEQRRTMAQNMARVANRVEDEGMSLCIESVNAARLPQMLLHHLADAAEVVRAVDHPAVRLIFDFAHIQAMDGDILANLDAVWDLIAIVQIADNPGRVEPGAGELNFDRLLDELVAREFAGPCELEHVWSVPGRQVQEAYLEWLGRWTVSEKRKIRDN